MPRRMVCTRDLTPRGLRVVRLLVVGSLVPLVVACAATTTPGPVQASSPAVTGSTSAASAEAGPSSPSPARQVDAVFCGMETSTSDLTRCWQRMLPALDAAFAPMATEVGATWTTPRMAVFGTKPSKNPCHGAVDGGVAGSFYCAGNDTVYLSTWEADRATRDYIREAHIVDGVLDADAKQAGVSVSSLRKGRPGQGQATIEAHEMAHHLLVAAGVQAWFDRRADKATPGTLRYDAYGFAPETAADCLTGASLRESQRQGRVRMNALDLWASRAWLAQTDPFNPEVPKASPFRYRNEWKGEQYRGYGGAYWRLKAFDFGWSTGAPGAVDRCVGAAARWKGLSTWPGIDQIPR